MTKVKKTFMSIILAMLVIVAAIMFGVFSGGKTFAPDTGTVTDPADLADRTTAITGIEYGVKTDKDGDASCIAGWGSAIAVQNTKSGLKSYLNVHTRPSLVEGKLLGDLIYIGDATFNEIKAGGKGRLHFYGNKIILQDINDRLAGAIIRILPGFVWYGGDECWSGDFDDMSKVDTYVMMEDMFFAKEMRIYLTGAGHNGTVEKVVDSAEFNAESAKLVYEQGDMIDVTGLSLSVTYFGETTATDVEVTADMCSYDFSSAGVKTVTVNYRNISKTYDVTVNEPTKTLTGISFSGEITTEQWTLPDLTGKKLTLNYDTGTNEEIALTRDMISGMDISEVKDVTLNVTYNEKHCTIPMHVTARTADSKLKGVQYGVSTQSKDGSSGGWGSGITFDVEGTLRSYLNIGTRPSLIEGKTIGDLIYIGDKTYNELNKGRINFYGNQIIFHDINGDLSGKTIRILPGFVWYSGDSDFYCPGQTVDYADKSKVDTYVMAPDYFVAEEIRLYMNGSGTSGKVEKVAQSVTLDKEGAKTSYYVNESLDLTGLKLNVTFFGESAPTEVDVTADMCEYDFTSEGTKTVTITYRGVECAFDVTVEMPLAGVKTLTVVASTVSAIQWMERNPDFSGIKFNVVFDDETHQENVSATYKSGIDTSVIGKQNAVFAYTRGDSTKECTVEIEVKDLTPEKYLIIDEFTLTPTNGSNTALGLEFAVSEAVDGTNLFRAVWHFENLGKNGDLVLLNGKTINQILADPEDNLIARGFNYGHKLGFHFDNGTEKLQSITFLKGFEMFELDKDYWGSKPTDANATSVGAILKQDMYFVRIGSELKFVKEVESVDFVTQPKTEYNIGEAFDVTGIELDVKYKGQADKERVALTHDMCEYDFSASGSKTVVVKFKNYEKELNVTVSAIAVSEITVDTMPTKTKYDFGIDDELDLAGMVVKAKYVNQETSAFVKEEEIPLTNITVTGYDSRKMGEQTITVVYGSNQTTFKVSVENISKSKYLEVDYTSAYASYESTTLNSLMVQFSVQGVFDELKPLWGVDECDYVADYILITYLKPNGESETKSVKELIENGWITRVCCWTKQMVFHMDTCNLLPYSGVDKRKDPTNPEDTGIHYVEGVSNVVTYITFLPGLQWYTADRNMWGDNEPNSAEYKLMKGAVLKERVMIENIDGLGWMRPLKANEDGDVEEGALTIASLPTKLEYTVGENFNISGLQLKAKYQDGGEENLTVSYSDVSGFDKDKVGKQTITITYAGQELTFEVEVKKAKKKGCGSLDLGLGIGVGLTAICAGAFVLGKRK